MSEWLPLITVFISGLFGLGVAVATSILTDRRASKESKRISAKEKHADTRSIYADSIVIFETAIRKTRRLESYEDMDKSMARNNALLLLVAPKYVTDQSEIASDLLHEWSSAYRQSAPTRVGENTVIISSYDLPKQQEAGDRATELYPKMIKEMAELAEKMKRHLRELEL